MKSLLHLAIEPSPTWNNVRAMVLEKLDEDGSEHVLTPEDVIWGDEGHDAEGTVEGIFKLVALKSIDALAKTQTDEDRSIIQLVRHDIPPVSPG
ncbi:hypothetical protein ACEPAI_4765 [Sanghuangporus weigelae]